MGEQNGAKWKDEGLDCLVLDEFLIPNPKNNIDISETNVDSETIKNGEEEVPKPDQVICLEPNILSNTQSIQILRFACHKFNGRISRF